MYADDDAVDADRIAEIQLKPLAKNNRILGLLKNVIAAGGAAVRPGVEAPSGRPGKT